MNAGNSYAVILGFAVFLCSLVAPLRSDEPTAQEIEASLGDYATMYEAGVRVRPPKGFPEQGRGGFGNRDNKCVLFAMKISTPYYEDLDKFALSLLSKKVLSREKVKVDGLQGTLLHIEEPLPNTDPPEHRRHWHCVFGDKSNSWVVSGIYYPELPPLVSASLRAAVLSAQPDNSPLPKSGQRQPFTIEPSAKLKIVDTVWRQLVFTEDGKLPLKSAISPIFAAGNFARRPKPPEDRREFAAKMREGETTLEQFEVQSNDEISLDGLKGYELQVKAKRVQTKTPVVLYYVVLYTDEEFFLLSGTSGSENSELYLPEFKAMARSLKQKPKPEAKRE